MDPDRIRKLTEEVLSQLGSAHDPEPSRDLEARVGALERAVFETTPAAPMATAVAVASVVTHPSHHFLRVIGGIEGEPCILEPDKPCTQSRRCQALGF